MARFGINPGDLKKLLLTMAVGWGSLIALSSHAQGTLNVTNFGAVGDAVQFYVSTTSNSVVVTTTNQMPASAIGESIEIFGAGLQTSGVDSHGNNTNGNQDMVATITNVVNGTNIYVSQFDQATRTNTFATYGHDNAPAFALAIAACNGTNDTINIPSGKYLLMPSSNGSAYGYASVWIQRGGIHFVGAGMTNTVLLGKGAWTVPNVSGTSNAVWRGFLFEFYLPITNDYPFSIENLTMDGGVQQGNTSEHGYPANPVDGSGWDGTSDAIVAMGQGNTFTHATWTNVMFTHWRGEMVKSLDGSTNGNQEIINCTFADGNATAINYYPSLNASHCLYSNLFQVAEYYQRYSTNTSYFQNNLVTNTTGNTFAINGGKGNNPPFVMQNNTFYLSGNGYNGIETTPADNVFIISNQFFNPNLYSQSIVISCVGAQGTFENSNIVVAGNTFYNPETVIELGGGSVTNVNDLYRVEGVQICSNNIVGPGTGGNVALLINFGGYYTNVNLFKNTVTTNSDPLNGNCRASVKSGVGNSAFYVLDSINNIYFSSICDLNGVTNGISYANGSRFEVIYSFHAGTVYALVDTNASQIPPGAQILIQNDNSSSATIPVYLNSALTIGPVNVPSGQSLVAMWTNGVWMSLSPNGPTPPTNVRVIVPGP